MSTFGYTTIGGTSGGTSADDIFLNKFTLSDVASITKMSFHHTAVLGNVKGIIYTDLNGRPRTRVAITNAAALSIGWTDATFAIPVLLSPGSYWIGAAYDNTCSYSYDVVGTRQYKFSSGYASPVATWWMDNPSDARQHSVYVTYDISTTGSDLSWIRA